MCGEAKTAHESLVHLMPTEVKNKTWFAAKMLVENDFIAGVEQWLTNDDDDDDGDDDDDDVHPDDSISNVASRHSHKKSTCSSKSSDKSGKSSGKSGKTTSSARIKAEAEKASCSSFSFKGKACSESTGTTAEKKKGAAGE